MKLKSTATPPAHAQFKSVRASVSKLAHGSAMVAVFWIMAVLSLAVFAAVKVVYHDADVSTSQIHGFDAMLAAERGVAIAVNPATQKTEPMLAWSDGESGLSYRARIESEAARFNINVILMRRDKQLLTDIFTDWGMELLDAQMLVDNLVDWVDSGDLTELNGAEIDWYEEQGRPNHPFNRPFYNLEEMTLVKDMDLLEFVNPRWRKWFTVWSNGKLDINEAEAGLIAAAAEVSIDDATTIVDYVLGPDQEKDTDDDQRFQNLTEAFALIGLSPLQQELVAPRLTVEDTTTRIVSEGRAGDVKRRITLVIKNRTGQPVILDRKEEIIP